MWLLYVIRLDGSTHSDLFRRTYFYVFTWEICLCPRLFSNVRLQRQTNKHAGCVVYLRLSPVTSSHSHPPSLARCWPLFISSNQSHLHSQPTLDGSYFHHNTAESGKPEMTLLKPFHAWVEHITKAHWESIARVQRLRAKLILACDHCLQND